MSMKIDKILEKIEENKPFKNMQLHIVFVSGGNDWVDPIHSIHIQGDELIVESAQYNYEFKINEIKEINFIKLREFLNEHV